MKPIFIVKCPVFETEEQLIDCKKVLVDGLDGYNVLILEDESVNSITCELFCIEKTEKLSSEKLDELVRLLNDKT